MFKVIAETPYRCGNCTVLPTLSKIRYDTVLRDGLPCKVQVVENLEMPDFGNLKSQDFSIQVIKDAGLLSTLDPTASVKLSPLAAQETVMSAVDALETSETSFNLKKVAAEKAAVEKSAAEKAASAQIPGPAQSAVQS